MLPWLAGAGEAAAPQDAAVSRPSLPAWRATWLESPGGAAGIPRSIAFVRALPKESVHAPEFAPIDVAAFEQASYLRPVKARVVAWDYELNATLLAKLDPLAAFVTVSHVDLIVIAPERGKWRLMRVPRGGTTAEDLGERRGPSSNSAKAVAAWVQQALGWDGVVLARQGDYLLVGATSEALAQPRAQALALTRSSDRAVLTDASREGAALLSLTATDGAFGMFDVVLQDQDSAGIEVGAKLLIEQP